MSQSLATKGFVSPASTGGGGGGGGPTGVLVPFRLFDTDGVPQAGIDLSAAGVVQVSKDGAALAARVGAAPTSFGRGLYYYQLDPTEVGAQFSVVSVRLAGYNDVAERRDFASVATSADVTSAVDDITSAFLAGVSSMLAALSSVQVNVNAHTDAEAAVINAHTDAQVSAAVATIDGHTDTAIAALQSHEDAQVAAAVSTIDANTNSARDTILARQATTDAHVDSALAPLASTLADVAGLHHKNSVLDGGTGQPSVQYNSRRLMTAARLRVFATKAAANAATPGHSDDQDGEILRYSISGTDTGIGTVAVFKLVKDL